MNPISIVTGGTKGIGKAIVEKLAAEGFDVITCARHEPDLIQLKADIEQHNPTVTVHTKTADLSLKSHVVALVEWIQSFERPVEMLVNNTGVFVPGHCYNEPEGQLETMITTNLYSAYYLTRGLVGGMITRRRGHIFNICSVASIMAYPNGGAYSISKFALYGLTKALREELKPFGIRVTAVLPGATLTPSWEGVALSEERFMKAEDVATMIWAAYQLSDRTVVEDLVIRPQLGDL